MKKPIDADMVKRYVFALLGKKVTVKHNRGRNRVSRYKGVLTEAHSNVFVVSLQNEVTDRLSCSYSDVVCGEIVLREDVTERGFPADLQ